MDQITIDTLDALLDERIANPEMPSGRDKSEIGAMLEYVTTRNSEIPESEVLQWMDMRGFIDDALLFMHDQSLDESDPDVVVRQVNGKTLKYRIVE